MCGSRGTVKSKAAADSSKISNRDQKYIFNKKQLEQAVMLSQKQIDKHSEHIFVKERFIRRLILYKNKLERFYK